MKISNQEWEALKTRIKNNKQIELAEQELARSKKMADIEKLQYYASDLAYSLDIGEIADMWVDTENGKQVLRMRVIPKKHDEFKTIRSEPKSNRGRERKPAPNARNTYKPVNASPKFDPGLDDGFGEKAARIGVNFGKSVVGWIRTPPKRKPEDW